jgi:hypothetical protein
VVALPTALSGTPRIVVDAYAADRDNGASTSNGNVHGRLLATLWDCSAPTICVELSAGHVEVQSQDDSPQPQDGNLHSVDAVVQAGHLLRLTLELEPQGNAASVVLLQGGVSASRLELTSAPSVVPLAGLGLIVLLLGTVVATGTKERKVRGGVDVAG